MDEIVQEFLEEADDNLQSADDALLTLERQPDEQEAVNTAFRVMHSIKGASGFLGLVRLGELAHKTENLLDAFRTGEVTPTSGRMQIVFDAVDRIRTIKEGIREHGGDEPGGDDSDLLNRIYAAISGETGACEAGSGESGELGGNADAPAAADQPAPDTAATAAGAEQDAAAAPSGGTGADDGAKPPAADGQAGRADGQGRGDDPQQGRDKADGAAGAGNGQGEKHDGGASSIRVSTAVLDRLQTTVSELVLIRNQLLQIDREQSESPHTSALQRLDQIVSEAQEGVMKTRMQEIGAAWKQMRRLVRDLNHELGKRIDLTTEGEDAELDRQILESLKKPLQHILRNAADHGIETPEDRRRAGKDETGRIHMAARQEAGHVIIDISDDGRGLDAQKIGRKAVEKGITTEEELGRLDAESIRQLLFRPGFSTADEVTSVSGRGVGMDVVRADIERIGGSVELTSAEGVGTRFTLKIPLTLAIISALIVRSGTERFAIPQSGINEIVRVSASDEDRSGAKIERMKGAKLLRLRDRLLPLVSLRERLDIDETEESADRYVVVAQVGSQRFGVIVDRVYDTEEIVVKPTSQLLSEIPYYSGCTILGDGNIVMILDPNGISPPADEADKAARAEAAQATQEQQVGARADDQENFLLFRTGELTPKACPLNVVERIEKIKAEEIEFGDHRAMVQYRGDLMPIVPFDGTVDLRQPEGSTISVLVFAEKGRRIGFAVDHVEDIVEAPMQTNWASETRGVLGTSVINGRTTDMIDMGDYLQDYADWFREIDSSEAGAGRGASGDTPRALYVDDSGLVRSIMVPVLTQTGYEVTCANDAVEAEEILETRGADFDVIISDIEMPRKDGIQFARDLSQDDRFKDIPRIALTSGQTEQDAQRCLNAGYDEHVGKFDRSKLFQAINDLVETRKAAA